MLFYCVLLKNCNPCHNLQCHSHCHCCCCCSFCGKGQCWCCQHSSNWCVCNCWRISSSSSRRRGWRFLELLFQLWHFLRKRIRIIDNNNNNVSFKIQCCWQQLQQKKLYKKRSRNAVPMVRLCNRAFMKCMADKSCINCFSALDEDDIDWASVSPNTSCLDVLDLLNKNAYCLDLKSNHNLIDLCCVTLFLCHIGRRCKHRKL